MATGGAHFDPRGVLRGRCDMVGCACRQYSYSESGKCANCSHPPARHLKVGPNVSGGNVHAAPQQPALQQDYHVPAPYFNPVPPSVPYLKDCAATGCSNKVHYDQELGPFDYCSPQCRDVHLLPIEREKLRRDIEKNSRNIAAFLQTQPSPRPSPPPSDRVTRSSAASAASAKGSSSVTSSTTTSDGKKKVMVSIEKKKTEPLGIITAKIPGETGFRVVGVELGTSAHAALKEGHIKLLDTITHMNEDEIQSKEWFDQFTRSKTRPLLTILRNHNSPSGIKALITKAEKKSKATHIKVAMNPAFVNLVDFGIEPLKTMTGTGATTGYFLGVNDQSGYTAHVCGISIRDEVLLYATMNSKTITDGRHPFSEYLLKQDIHEAMTTGKHLIFVIKHTPIDY